MKKLAFAAAVSLIMTTSLMMSTSMTYAHNGTGSASNKHDKPERSGTGKDCHRHNSNGQKRGVPYGTQCSTT